MKAQYINCVIKGFSTIELLIALSLMSVIMVGAIESILSAQYWFTTAQISNEALHKNKIILLDTEKISKENFQQVSTSKPALSLNPNLESDRSCIEGGQCYYVDTNVIDISSCAKDINVSVSWKIAERYATNSITSSAYLSNKSEILAVGGDCLVESLHGDWGTDVPIVGSLINFSPQQITGMDVLQGYAYVTSAQAPFFRIFKMPEESTLLPVLVGSSSVSGLRLNDVEVIRDYLTGRIYAYLMQHSTTSQLVVLDVSEFDNPVTVTQLTLQNVASNGSFPQGWRVVAYGGQLFAVSRETTGPELHIFSITDPRFPVEISTAPINLNRTVNDMVIRDEIVNDEKRRFLYLAASSDLKEVGVYDVTEDTPVEVAAINLSGSADASAIYLNGSILYVGRKSSSVQELYAFNNQKLIVNELEVLATGEVGGEVLSLIGTGKELVVGTGRNGSELQIWSNNINTWNPSILNAGQLSTLNSPRLAPLGIDVGSNNLVVISQSQTQPEVMSIMYRP